MFSLVHSYGLWLPSGVRGPPLLQTLAPVGRPWPSSPADSGSCRASMAVPSCRFWLPSASVAVYYCSLWLPLGVHGRPLLQTLAPVGIRPLLQTLAPVGVRGLPLLQTLAPARCSWQTRAALCLAPVLNWTAHVALALADPIVWARRAGLLVWTPVAGPLVPRASLAL